MKSPKISEGKLKEILDTIELNVSRLYHVATHDEKTGLYNHVFFKDIFGMELEKAKRGKKLSLVILDIDFFKKINDTHGHLQADKILKRLATVLQETVRKSDVVARFGGEEFFVMLPNTSLKRAGVIANRLRKVIMKDEMMSKFSVTVSGGVAEYKKNDNLERISVRADKGLYKAKETGRNRICFV